MLPPPVKVVAEQHNITPLQPESIRSDEFFQTIAALEPDLIVVTAYGKMIPESLLNLPPLGIINAHGSLLPKYRGAAPIQWAVINGEEETGVTIMQMDKGMDTGDILCSVSTPVSEDDTAGSMFEKLARLSGKTFIHAIALLKEKKLSPLVQNESQATLAPMLSKEQGHIDWMRTALELHCLIRGLDPWPSAYGFIGGTRFRFFSPLVVEDDSQNPPGTILRADGQGLLIATGSGSLLIREIQPEGKKRMSVKSCLCGTKLITTGDRFN
jgi:methionyl-tRNA formyltransferase